MFFSTVASLLVRTMKPLAGFLPVHLTWSLPASHCLPGATPCTGPLWLGHLDPLLAPSIVCTASAANTWSSCLLLQSHGELILIPPVSPEEQVIDPPTPDKEKDAFGGHQLHLRNGPLSFGFFSGDCSLLKSLFLGLRLSPWEVFLGGAFRR